LSLAFVVAAGVEPVVGATIDSVVVLVPDAMTTPEHPGSNDNVSPPTVITPPGVRA
jgi:hypothetical protein